MVQSGLCVLDGHRQTCGMKTSNLHLSHLPRSAHIMAAFGFMGMLHRLSARFKCLYNIEDWIALAEMTGTRLLPLRVGSIYTDQLRLK